MTFRIGCIVLVLALFGVRALFGISAILGFVSIAGVLVLFLLLARTRDLMIRLPEWISRLIEPGEDNRRWRELCRTARVNRLQSEARARQFWNEWTPLHNAGRDAYASSDYAEARRAFESMLTIGERFNLHHPHKSAKLGFRGGFPTTVAESPRWWQGAILMDGAFRWNTWRRANPGVRPDLQSQNLCGGESLNGVDLSGADLRAAHCPGKNFIGGDFHDSNLARACLAECLFRNADFRNANLEYTDLSGADLTGATGLTDSQLASARGDLDTEIPDNLRRPASWHGSRACDS